MRFPRRLLLSLSLANLLALQLWIELFKGGQSFLVDGQEYLGALGAVLLVGAVFYAVSFTEALLPAVSRDRVRAVVLFAAMALLAWTGIKPLMLGWLPLLLSHGKSWLLPGTLVVLALMIFLVHRCARGTVSVVSSMLLVFSPFLAITFGQALWQVHRVGLGLNTAAYPRAEAPRLPAGGARLRTVVLIFDEFDYEIAFADPKVAGELARFSALRNEHGAFFATSAYPPMHSTMMSLPAMLTGRLVRDSAFQNEPQGDLLLSFSDGESRSFSQAQTLFSDLRASGKSSLRMNEAVLPPMRLAGPADADLVIPAAGRRAQGVGYHLRNKLAEWFAILPYSRSQLWDMRILHLLELPHPWERKEAILTQMASLAADADADLLLLHVLLPHKPVVFDRGRGDLGPNAGPSYRDNLLATDLALGRIVDAIKQAGRWNDTHLVVTTDHFYRNKSSEFGLGDHRIPYLVHLAGDRSAPMSFETPFNTVSFRPMVGAIARGEVKSVADLAVLVKSGAAFGESPLTEYRKGW